MNKTVSKSPRCRYRTQSGRLCRLTATTDSKFCSRHASLNEHPTDFDLEGELTAGLEKFDSPGAINDFLTRLARLLAQDRISPRRAAVLAYISNQILRSVHAMEEMAEQNKEPTKIEYVIEMPRPYHNDPEESSAEAVQLQENKQGKTQDKTQERQET
jgi:hypothetical protein